MGSIGAANFGESDVFTVVPVDDDDDDDGDGDDDDDDEVDEDDGKSELIKTEPPMTMVAVSNLRWLCFLMAYLSIYCNMLFVLILLSCYFD